MLLGLHIYSPARQTKRSQGTPFRCSLGGDLSLQPRFNKWGSGKMRERERDQRLESVGVGRGAGPACLNRWNNQLEAKAILRLGLLYGKQRSLADEKAIPAYCCNLTSAQAASMCLLADPLPSSPLLVSFKCSFSSKPHKHLV